MLNFIRAEMLKQKRRFSFKLLWLAPILTVLLAVAVMVGTHLQDSAYNWWYTLLLPANFTMFISLSVASERRKNRHGLFGVVVCKKQLWISQVVFYTGYLFATCLVFFLAAGTVCFVFGASIDLWASALASLVLFITFAWQVPLWMAVTEKAGKFAAILISLLLNFGIAVVSAPTKIWWIPFSIPARLMCPIIGVMPNGLPVELGSAPASPAVILPGILITIALYVVASATTSLWYNKREVS